MILDAIRPLIGKEDWKVSDAADTLRCRLRAVEEDTAGTDYRLCGGVASPFSSATLRWIWKTRGGVLAVNIDPADRPGMEEVRASLREFTQWTPLLPDPRDPEPKRCLVYKVPAGELRLVFPDYEKDSPLESFVVSSFPIVRWEESP